MRIYVFKKKTTNDQKQKEKKRKKRVDFSFPHTESAFLPGC